MKPLFAFAVLFVLPLPIWAQDAEAEVIKILEEKKGLVNRQKSRPYAVQSVSFLNSDITDFHAALLGTFPALDHADLTNTQVGDATVAELTKCKKLKFLALRGTPITDASLKSIGTMKAMQMLDLRDTQITDAGLMELAKCKVLKNLLVGGSKVTPSGAMALQKALPNCGIEILAPK